MGSRKSDTDEGRSVVSIVEFLLSSSSSSSLSSSLVSFDPIASSFDSSVLFLGAIVLSSFAGMTVDEVVGSGVVVVVVVVVDVDVVVVIVVLEDVGLDDVGLERALINSTGSSDDRVAFLFCRPNDCMRAITAAGISEFSGFSD